MASAQCYFRPLQGKRVCQRLVSSIKGVKKKTVFLRPDFWLASSPPRGAGLLWPSVPCSRAAAHSRAAGLVLPASGFHHVCATKPVCSETTSSTVVRCQPWFYWGLMVHSFFGLSEGD